MKEKLKKKAVLILGLMMLPFAYSLWVADRLMFVIMPQSEHKSLNDWLNNKSIVFSITRIATVIILRYLIKLIFGY